MDTLGPYKPFWDRPNHFVYSCVLKTTLLLARSGTWISVEQCLIAKIMAPQVYVTEYQAICWFIKTNREEWTLIVKNYYKRPITWSYFDSSLKISFIFRTWLKDLSKSEWFKSVNTYYLLPQNSHQAVSVARFISLYFVKYKVKKKVWPS